MRSGIQAGDRVEPICVSKCLDPQLGRLKVWWLTSHLQYVWILSWGDAKKDKDCSPRHLYMAWLPHNTVTSGKSNFLLQFRALSASVSANMGEIPLPFMTLLRSNYYFWPRVWLKVVTTSPDSERAHKTLLLQEEYQTI